MLTRVNLEQFTRHAQTTPENVIREYCQHLFLAYLYQQPGSEQLLFKGGTALRIVFHSPRYSEDLDFTGVRLTQSSVEDLFTNALVQIEKSGMHVKIKEGKPTTGGYLGIVEFDVYEQTLEIYFEVSLRYDKQLVGERHFIENDYIQPYTLVCISKEMLVQGKIDALINRHKPRDFYDYFFLLSGNYPIVKEKENLTRVLVLIRGSKIDFRRELQRFLPASHAMYLKDLKKMLEQKILQYGGT